MWGSDDTDLMTNVQLQDQSIKDAQPGVTFTFTFPNEPLDVFWKLDKKNFTKIIVSLAVIFGASAGAVDIWWDLCLNGFPNSTFGPGGNDLITLEDSPRATFNASGNGLGANGKEKSLKTTVVPPESLLDALRTFAGSLISAGFINNGPRSLLAQLTSFIAALVAGTPVDPVRLGILLQKIESAFN